jgi:hypothetical protein
VTNQDCRGSIRGGWKKLFNCLSVCRDTRRGSEQPNQSGPDLREGRIAEKRRSQQDMTMVLDQQTRDPQVRNGNDAGWIAALGGRASDSVWPRFHLVVDRDRGVAPDH